MLNKLLCKPADQLTEETITEFETRSRKRGCDFVDIYHAARVTPYIHAMLNHMPEFMQTHDSILRFTQQGLEKLKDNATNHLI